MSAQLASDPVAKALAVAADADIRRFWSKVALPDEDGCMLWMAGRFTRGYARFKIKRQNVGGHRFILWYLEGPPPSPGFHAAHSCGDTRCVSPLHLRSATVAENSEDARQHRTLATGSRNGASRLAESQVREIRRLYSAGGVTQEELGRMYGVSQGHISHLIVGDRWAHLEEVPS